MLYSTEDTYEFSGFFHDQKYKISAICVDKDGDEWNVDGVEFVVDNPAIATYTIPTIFNRKTTTIDISLDNLLAAYQNATFEFYRALKNDVGEPIKLEYAGGGLSKTNGAIGYNKWIDYNIRNDSYYDYYIRVEYTGKDSDTDQGIDFILVATDVHVDFEGTSILGIEKNSDTKLNILNSFNLFLHIDSSMSELKNEISREYINTFSRYPKELKGHQNYISGSCSGLLGSECNGIYEEARGIRNSWNKFVNDDSIKLYRGLDGETMVISIDSSRVKPFYYPNVGLVNEVYITFKEIASASHLTIFRTEKTGD
jgi:hypothetical protein